MVHETVHRFGRLDVYVNNAGVTRDATTPKMSLEQFRSGIDIHFKVRPAIRGWYDAPSRKDPSHIAILHD
jgi:NAD(P)-dependent dehydrogenase (short-subunit alcohol dehydrogenase family)